MAGAFEQKTGVRILFGVIIGILALSMLLYLVPQGTTTAESATDVVARVGDQTITLSDIRSKMNEISQRNQIPKQLEGLYARQILNQEVFQREISYEAKRMGITVSDREVADQIKMYVPNAYKDGVFVGQDAYAQEVRTRFQGMTVPVFEDLVRQGMVEQKFRELITDGISVSQAEIEQQYRYQSEKVKLDYVLIKPEDLAASYTPDAAQIQTYFDQNKAKYQIPEKRVIRYALIDLVKLRQSMQVTDDELKPVYQENIQQYEVPNRVHAEHILFMTVGKTDAEVAEIKKKAEDVLAQAKKKGANFEDLAKKYSEDPGSKAKGGDLGWIQMGQTVPEFQTAAFSLPKGDISNLVKTQYGFHIIKVLDKEEAHTKTFDEVKDSIRGPYLLQKADSQAAAEADKMSADIRQSSRMSLDELAKKYNLPVAETRAVSADEPVFELGNSKDLKDQIINLKTGELSLPIRTDRGYAVLALKSVTPAHPGTLDEVRDKVIADLKQVKGVELAKAKAEDLEKKVKGGEKFDSAAKSLGLEAKTSDDLTRDGSIANVGSGKQLSAAFGLKDGELGSPTPLGGNWVVYQVVAKTEANMADFDKAKKAITDKLLQDKRQLAFEAFRTSLDQRLKSEGKLKIMPEKMRGFGDMNTPNS